MRLLLLFLSTVTVALAQQPTRPASTLSKSEQAEVRNLARKQVENLQTLLNIIAFTDASEFEVNTVIKNSFLPNANQLFLNDGVIVEDDIDPQNVGKGTPVDAPVETYLRNLNLFYIKTERPTIALTDIIARNEQVGTRLIIKVYFTSTFTSKHNQINQPYVPTQRVAEFQAERVGKVWSVLITRLGFVNVPPPLPPPPPPRPLVKGKGWLFVAGGVASFIGGYLVYNKIHTDYQTYTSRVNTLNAEYNQWRELSRQPTGGPIASISFPAYAGSSGYVIYGAGAASLGLSITGIAKFIKAGRLNKRRSIPAVTQ